MGRTKGSRNGISTTPGYVAIGKLADPDWKKRKPNGRVSTTGASEASKTQGPRYHNNFNMSNVRYSKTQGPRYHDNFSASTIRYEKEPETYKGNGSVVSGKGKMPQYIKDITKFVVRGISGGSETKDKNQSEPSQKQDRNNVSGKQKESVLRSGYKTAKGFIRSGYKTAKGFISENPYAKMASNLTKDTEPKIRTGKGKMPQYIKDVTKFVVRGLSGGSETKDKNQSEQSQKRDRYDPFKEPALPEFVSKVLPSRLKSNINTLQYLYPKAVEFVQHITTPRRHKPSRIERMLELKNKYDDINEKLYDFVDSLPKKQKSEQPSLIPKSDNKTAILKPTGDIATTLRYNKGLKNGKISPSSIASNDGGVKLTEVDKDQLDPKRRNDRRDKAYAILGNGFAGNLAWLIGEAVQNYKYAKKKRENSKKNRGE